MTKNTMRLQNGDVIREGEYGRTRSGEKVGPMAVSHSNDPDGDVWGCKGVQKHSHTDGMWAPNGIRWPGSDYAVATDITESWDAWQARSAAPKLTIREGGFYRTRDGRKVGPMRDHLGINAYPFDCDQTGQYYRADGVADDGVEYDIIAEWTGAAPAEGTLRELDVKPGDVVELLDRPEYSGRWALPPVGYILAIAEDGSWYGIGAQYLHELTCRFRLVSRAPATDDATIQRVMEASAPVVDDPVTHPAHYTSHPSGVECLTITRWMGFNLGNAVKYIWRADMKGAAIEDLRKAAFYIADEIAKREAEGAIDPASYRVEARG